jgi:hypothetical protein
MMYSPGQKGSFVKRYTAEIIEQLMEFRRWPAICACACIEVSIQVWREPGGQIDISISHLLPVEQCKKLMITG